VVPIGVDFGPFAYEHMFGSMTSEGDPDQQSDFHILALDGGGLKGLYSAALLARLEQDTGTQIRDHFDLITGTSTGGIIALGLGLGLSPWEIVEFYTTQGPRIFRGRSWRSLQYFFRRKYPAVRLETALKGVFDSKTLGDSTKPLVIPAYDLDRDGVYLFKTPHHERLRRDWRVPVWEVAMATAAAPTFFPSFRLTEDRTRLVDGGVWANNPAMVGIVEAVSMFGRDLSQLRVLSLGTTSEASIRKHRLNNGGLIQWGRGGVVLDVLLRGQSIGAVAEAMHLIGPERVHRVDPIVPEGFVALDAVTPDDLISMASGDSRELSPSFHSQFASHTAAPYEPLYKPNS
jgi:uncharacterized protein